MSNHNQDDIVFDRLRRPSVAYRRANRRGPRSNTECRPPVLLDIDYDQQAPLPLDINSEPQPPTEPPAESLLVDVADRPKDWHCIACGWHCNEPGNDYLCRQCGALRPFAGGGVTMILCNACKHWSLALARFCEWCGTSIWSS
jgi:hypothetical protein